MRRTASHADPIQPIAEKRIDVATHVDGQTHGMRPAIPRQLLDLDLDLLPLHSIITTSPSLVWWFDFPLPRAELPHHRTSDALIVLVILNTPFISSGFSAFCHSQ